MTRIPANYGIHRISVRNFFSPDELLQSQMVSRLGNASSSALAIAVARRPRRHLPTAASMLILVHATTLATGVRAQQLLANGTTQSDPANTTRVTTGLGAAGFAYWAVNGGTITTVGPVFLTADSIAAVAQSGGAIDLGNGSTVRTNGIGSYGLYSTGGSIRGSNLSITTLADLAFGARVDFAGQAALLNPTFQTFGNGAYGAVANGNGSTLVMQGALVSTTGTASFGTTASGVVAEFGGQVELSNSPLRASSVTTTGANSIGLLSQSGGGLPLSMTSFTVTGTPTVPVVVTTAGANAAGAYVQGGAATPAAMTLTDVVIFTSGVGSIGAGTLGDGATLQINSGSVTTIGDSASGVVAESGGSVTLTANAAVSTNGADAHAAVVRNGGILTALNSTLIAAGPNADGLLLTSPPNVTGRATLTGTTLEAFQGPSISADGGIANVALNGSTVTRNNGRWLQVASSDPLNPTTATILADASFVQGVALTDALSTSNVTLQRGSLWTVTGSSNLTDLTNDASLIAFSPPSGDPALLASYKRLTTGNYTGVGGTLGLNSFLGNDSSPSDRLVINGGAATGNSLLRIRNTTGAGDLTIGNGILVVDTLNGGTTVPGAFTLAGPVVAGPYEYSLYRSSRDAAGPQNWYLRSELTPVPPTPPAPTPTPPGPTPAPPGPTPPAPSPAPPPTGLPDYRRETSLYAALPAMELIYGRTLLDSLHERVGELRPLEAAPVTEERTIWCNNPEKNFRCTTVVQLPAGAVAPGRSYASAGWARIIGTRGERDGGPWGIYRNGPNFDYNTYGLQAGLDLYHSFNPDGSRDYAGIYAAVGRMEGDVTHFNRIKAGTNTINGYTVGAYWTHFGPSGWYLDGVVQGTWYDAKADSKRGFVLNRDSFGFAASLEGGYPIQLGYGVILEPQAQIVYQTITNGSASDGAALVRFSDADSLAGRIGARLARSWTLEEASVGAKPRMLTAWLKASLWTEFLGNPKTAFSSDIGFIPFRADLGGTWAEFKVGADAQLTKNTALYATAGYSIGLSGRSHGYDGRLGVKVTW